MTDQNKGTGGSTPNPAKEVTTPVMPLKSTRDDGHNIFVNMPKGGKNDGQWHKEKN